MVHTDNQNATHEQEVRMAAIYFLDMSSATMQSGGRTSLQLASTVLVKTLLEHVCESTNYVKGTFEFMLQKASAEVNLAIIYVILSLNFSLI